MRILLLSAALAMAACYPTEYRHERWEQRHAEAVSRQAVTPDGEQVFVARDANSGEVFIVRPLDRAGEIVIVDGEASGVLRIHSAHQWDQAHAGPPAQRY